jgi:hypothetical protein
LQKLGCPVRTSEIPIKKASTTAASIIFTDNLNSLNTPIAVTSIFFTYFTMPFINLTNDKSTIQPLIFKRRYGRVISFEGSQPL